MRTLLFILALALLADKKQTPTEVTEADRFHLQAIEAKLNLLQMQINQQAAPLLKERDEIYRRACTAVHIEPAKCVIDTVDGKISQRAEPKQEKK